MNLKRFSGKVQNIAARDSGAWQQAGLYIRNASQADDGLYVWGWMPGVYDSVASALLGVKACFEDEERFVNEVQRPINHMDMGDRLITESDIEAKFKETQ